MKIVVAMEPQELDNEQLSNSMFSLDYNSPSKLHHEAKESLL